MKLWDEKLAEKYDAMAEEFKPSTVDVLFVAESPPAPKKVGRETVLPYFYNPKPGGGRSLTAQMQAAPEEQEIVKEVADKEEFLSAFQENRFFLIDVFPTHACLKDFEETGDAALKSDLIKRFSDLVTGHEPEQIVFICKRAIRQLSLPFPLYSNQTRFREELRELL